MITQGCITQKRLVLLSDHAQLMRPRRAWPVDACDSAILAAGYV